MAEILNILAIEPYYGGSHKNFIDGLIRHSRHSFELFQLPARKWKWRMRGAAINAAQWLHARGRRFDIILASDFLSMADLAALCPSAAGIPKVAFFHESQFDYPDQPDAKPDYQFLFTNITTCLAADRVIFNSAFHRDSFIRETAAFMRRMPDFVPAGIAEAIAAKASVLHVGCELDDCGGPPCSKTGPAVILWNHRWEHDKDPEAFFGVLFDLLDEGADFRVIVVGESFRRYPSIFDTARERLAGRIIQFGYAPDRAAYLRALKQSDIIVSTARQEFFGVAVVEAVASGCYPLLPNRLSYPELLPEHHRRRHLYANAADLKRRLAALLADPAIARSSDLRGAMQRFSWAALAPQYDAALEAAGSNRMKKQG